MAATFSRAVGKCNKLEPGGTLDNISRCFTGGRAGRHQQDGSQLRAARAAKGAHGVGLGMEARAVRQEGGGGGACCLTSLWGLISCVLPDLGFGGNSRRCFLFQTFEKAIFSCF